MARTEKVIMTNMCMVFSENRILVQDKTDDDYSGITFPGGHVERGESFTDGVKDHVIRYVYIIMYISLIMIFL